MVDSFLARMPAWLSLKRARGEFSSLLLNTGQAGPADPFFPRATTRFATPGSGTQTINQPKLNLKKGLDQKKN